MFRIYKTIDVRSLLPIIQVPTLVLHAIGDPLLDIEQGRYLAEHIPGARLVEFPGQDHYPWREGELLAGEIEEFLTGERTGVEPDRVLATILFSDIVSSTERATELGDRRWRDLLDGHDTMVRRQLERFRGREVKTTGDGFLAVFDGPARAIHCASAIRDGVRAVGLEVRVGLHTGEVEIRGDDISGIAVHIARRVESMADPGEVLVSRTLVDLVAGSNITFTDRGEHQLKGIPTPWHLYTAQP